MYLITGLSLIAIVSSGPLLKDKKAQEVVGFGNQQNLADIAKKVPGLPKTDTSSNKSLSSSTDQKEKELKNVKIPTTQSPAKNDAKESSTNHHHKERHQNNRYRSISFKGGRENHHRQDTAISRDQPSTFSNSDERIRWNYDGEIPSASAEYWRRPTTAASSEEDESGLNTESEKHHRHRSRRTKRWARVEPIDVDVVYEYPDGAIDVERRRAFSANPSFSFQPVVQSQYPVIHNKLLAGGRQFENPYTRINNPSGGYYSNDLDDADGGSPTFDLDDLDGDDYRMPDSDSDEDQGLFVDNYDPSEPGEDEVVEIVADDPPLVASSAPISNSLSGQYEKRQFLSEMPGFRRRRRMSQAPEESASSAVAATPSSYLLCFIPLKGDVPTICRAQ